MKRTAEILEGFAKDIVPEIQKVSKRFAPTVESEVHSNVLGATLEITASPYIMTLVDGRRPTSRNAPRGNPTLQQVLFDWAKGKGIIPKPTASGRIPTLEQVSWAMAKSMHQKGDLLYQRGGGNNIFDAIITKSRIDNLLNLLIDSEFNEISSQATREFNF